jgi:uncharacterized protein
MKHKEFGLTVEDIQEIRRILGKYPQISKSLIYGSRARGDFKQGSDVDIAVYCDESFDDLWKISSELNEETLMPYHFDVVDYNKINNKELKEQIDKYGREF